MRDVVLWIDHREAVFAALTDDTEELTRILSGMEQHIRYSAFEGGAEDKRDRRFEGHLNQYYDKVIASVREARSVLIIGPGEAKNEVEKRLRDEGLDKTIIGVEAADKMTDPQIAALARQRFQEFRRRNGKGALTRESFP
jgi:stalled ribosome rescue protein Dom34